eukprot:1200967-Rhodomonas_salina.2
MPHRFRQNKTPAGHRIAPYAGSVPGIAYHHTLAQYQASHSTIRWLSAGHRSSCRASHSTVSTRHRIAPYAGSVPDIA